MSRSSALIIFVKTPGASSVKTRLAQGIGKDKAEEFYKLCLRASETRARAVQERLPGLQVYWAVAEDNYLQSPIWQGFPALYQGEGTLGERLATIYRQVIEKNSNICFIGADSPQITVERLAHCIQATESNRKNGFQLGRATDGGFYFFGGGPRVPDEVWTEVEYSTERTADDLSQRLSHYGSVSNLPEDFDVDTYEDLIRLSEIEIQDCLLPEQKKVILWARALHRQRAE